MPAGGSDSFKETTEGVSAKLNVEVPEKALTTLTALSKQTEAYRVSMEAAERSQGKHQEYLEKMPQIAEAATSKLKEWCDQVERAVDLKAKLGDFAGIPGAVGQDSSNPFGTGTTLGRGDLAHLASDPSRLVSMGNQRGLVDGAQVGLMSDDQIKKLADALTQAVGGGGDDSGGGSRPRRPGSKHSTPEEDQGLSPKRLEEHALKGRDLFGHVIGEMGEGASAGDALGAGRDLLGTMEGAGGMLGKIGGFLGPVGAGVGLALTANQLLQMGGERIQDYRRLGIESGGGMAEGMKYDAQAKMLALDPFITTAQAREVIQGALNAGMGGDQFDNVTGFIAKNLKDMNLSVAESVKVLQTNVEHGGMSIDQLSTSLANVTALAKRSSEGQSELNADFAANTQVLTGLGVSGPQGDISSQFLGAFANSPLLQGTNTALVAGLASPAFSAQVAMTAAGQGINIGNAGPRVAMQKLAKSGQLFNVTMETLKKMAVMAQSQSGGDADAGVERFQNLLTSQGIQIGVNEARGLYEQLLSPGGMKAAIDSGNAATTEANKPIDQGFVDTSLSGLYTLGNHIGNVLSEGKNVISDVLTFNWGNLGNDVDATNKRKGEIDRQHEADAGMYTTETLKRAVSQYGTANLQVFDSSGKNPQALDQSNKEQRDKLISGDLLIAPQGQKPMSLAQFGNSQAAAGAVGNQNVNVTAAPITVRYEGPITGPSAVPLTTNQQQANAGYGTATDNHAPPGT